MRRGGRGWVRAAPRGTDGRCREGVGVEHTSGGHLRESGSNGGVHRAPVAAQGDGHRTVPVVAGIEVIDEGGQVDSVG